MLQRFVEKRRKEMHVQQITNLSASESELLSTELVQWCQCLWFSCSPFDIFFWGGRVKLNFYLNSRLKWFSKLIESLTGSICLRKWHFWWRHNKTNIDYSYRAINKLNARQFTPNATCHYSLSSHTFPLGLIALDKYRGFGIISHNFSALTMCGKLKGNNKSCHCSLHQSICMLPVS